MKRLLTLLRNRRMQKLWERVYRISLIGMNYWSSEFEVTGEREALAFIASQLRSIERPVVFDVGANVGDFAVAALAAFGRDCAVHCFEPSLSTFELLKGNRQLARPNIACHRLALSDREGTATLHSSEPGSSIASLEQLERPVRPFDESLDERVDVTTIDRFCAQSSIGAIDLLKLDIEGHELAALKGAERMIGGRRIRFIQFEFGENDISARTFLGDLLGLLPAGSRLWRIVPGGPVSFVYAGGVSEVFATMNYLALLPD